MADRMENAADLDQILRDQFTTEFRKGYITVDGVCLPERYERYAAAIEDLEVRDDDVWVCSFPKTGTTWTQEMVWCIANDLDFEGAKVSLPERFPFLEHSVLFDYSTVLPKYPGLKPQRLVVDSVDYVKNLPSPRFIKTHLPFHLLPREIRSGEKRPRIIYVSRNAKDTCVSYYHHCRLLEGYRGDFHDFTRLFLNGKLCFAPFWDHVLGFSNEKHRENFLFLKYEDMKSDLRNVIRKTEKFLTKEILSDDKLQLLLNHLSFESMKSNRAVNYEDSVELNKKLKLIEIKGAFIRSGKMDQWKGEMSQTDIDRFDEMTERKLTAQNFHF